MKFDEKGRCCGRKPIHYKGGSWCSPPGSPMYFCDRCDRQYDPETGNQVENWAWTPDRMGIFRKINQEKGEMGLDTTHDCYHGSYTSFAKWREELSRAAGITYYCGGRNRTAAEIDGDWAEPPDDILYVLIDHADCDGHIHAEHCAPLADRLEGLLPKILGPPEDQRVTTMIFVAGLRSAAAKGEMVLFR